MSFLSELQNRKAKLKEAKTIVTDIDGKRHIEKGDNKESIDANKYGFIVDNAPDDIPVEITDFIYIGSQDCTNTNVLEKYNIKHVLSLGIEVPIDSNINNLFAQCLDLPETDIKLVLNKTLPFIQNCVDLKENVLIHCNAGVSRTSMVAIGYLMHYKMMQFEVAYNLVKEKRPAIQPNSGFRKQLKSFEPGKVI